MWNYLRENKLHGFKPSYHDLAFPSRVAINIFVKKSSWNLILSLCICQWNLIRCRIASSSFPSMNLGKLVCQSMQGIRFGIPGIWAWFIGAYLRAVESILKIIKTPRSSSNYWFLNSGVAMKILNLWILGHRSCQVKDAQPFFCLIIVHHQQSDLIFFVVSQRRYDLSFPDNGAKMLSPTMSQAEEEIKRGNPEPLSAK